MAIKITYFVHGATIDNEKGRYTGWYDIGLSELGIQQSIALAKTLKGKQFDALFCSDRKRAEQSARILWGEHAKLHLDPRLREVNLGKFDRRPAEEIESVMANHINRSFPGGQSYYDVEIQIRDFLGEIKKSYDKKHIAIVAHRAPQLALDVVLKGKTWEQAIKEDWRLKKAWQPGWDYELK